MPTIVGGCPCTGDGKGAAAARLRFFLNDNHIGITAVGGGHGRRRRQAAAARRDAACRKPNQHRGIVVRQSDGLRGSCHVATAVGCRPGAGQRVVAVVASNGFIEGNLYARTAIVGGRDTPRDWRDVAAGAGRVRWYARKNWRLVVGGNVDDLRSRNRVAAGVRGRPSAGDGRCAAVARLGLAERDGQVAVAKVIGRNIGHCWGRLAARHIHTGGYTRQGRWRGVRDDDPEKEAVHVAAGIGSRPAAVAGLEVAVHRTVAVGHVFREIYGRCGTKIIRREAQRIQRGYLGAIGEECVAVHDFPEK